MLLAEFRTKKRLEWVRTVDPLLPAVLDILPSRGWRALAFPTAQLLLSALPTRRSCLNPSAHVVSAVGNVLFWLRSRQGPEKRKRSRGWGRSLPASPQD